jgi:hypothetical protein
MKTTLVRLSIVALALAGFGASSVLSSAASTKPTVVAFTAGGSTASCLPNDPDACGIH